METCVLIPQEFSLVATASGARHSGEQTVSVWTSTRIKQGAMYHPFQGTVRFDKLNLYSYLNENDVSTSINFPIKYQWFLVLVSFFYSKLKSQSIC